MSLRPENPRAAKAATLRRKLKRAGRASRSRAGMRQLQPSVAQLDKLWALCIKARDGGRCLRCGETGHLQAAHIRSRRYHSTRWHLCNGLALCAGCHLWAHHNPLGFADFINKGPLSELPGNQVASLLLAQMLPSKSRADRALVLLSLQGAARKLGVSL